MVQRSPHFVSHTSSVAKINAKLTTSAASPTSQSPAKHVVYPVYLRPEQNIPEVFGNTQFKPIEGGEVESDRGVAGSAGGVAKGQEKGGVAEKEGEKQQPISRDDIVVTVRSAQV